MRLFAPAVRPLGAGLRLAPMQRLSLSTHLIYLRRYQHHGPVGNNQDDDDDDDEDWAMEEDDEPDFQNNFFPVKLGQVFDGRYQILQKIYWGSWWTFWFCLDQRTNRYVTLKVSTAISSQFDDHPVTRELQNHRYIQSIKSTHPGRAFIRPLLDTFDISRSDGRFHRFLVHPSFVTQIRGHKDIKSDVYSVLQALDFLHTVNMTHCNIWPLVVARGVQDERVFDDVWFQNHSDPMEIKGHPVYQGECIAVDSASYNLPMLSGLQYSRIGPLTNSLGRIQIPGFRAPEVVLKTGKYSHAIDIWNLGCFVCSWNDSFAPLFVPYDSKEGHYSVYLHLAQMISLLGPPPRELLARSSASPFIFNDDRRLISPAELDLKLVDSVLHDFEKRERITIRTATTKREAYPRYPLPVRLLKELPCVYDQPEKDRDHFVDFIHRTLAWQPEQRDTAAELLQHPWLREYHSLGVFCKMYCSMSAYNAS